MTDDPFDDEHDRIFGREALYARDGNPLHVWEEIHDLPDEEPYPEWVRKALRSYSEKIMEILDGTVAGKTKTQAKLVGTALGFGGRRGQRGWFQRAAAQDDDERLFFDVTALTKPILKTRGGKEYFAIREKLNTAYDIVAADRGGIDRSTVARACGRVLKRWREAITDEDLRKTLQTMATYVRFELRCFNEALDQFRAARRERDADDDGQ